MKFNDFLTSREHFDFISKFGSIGCFYESGAKLSYDRKKDGNLYDIPDDMLEEQIVELMQKCLAEGNDKSLFNLIKNNKVYIVPNACY